MSLAAPLRDESEVLIPGFEFTPTDVSVSRDRQDRKLGLAGVDPAVHGNSADISFFAFYTIMALRYDGLSINGSVHMSQHYELFDPIAVDETVSMQGHVVSVDEAPKGRIVTAKFNFVRPDGSIPLVAQRTSIRIDPDRQVARGGSNKSAGDPGTDMELLAVKQLEPEGVAGYSDEAENLIHSDPEVARQFGYRAPIAGGLMASHFIMDALAREGAIRTLDMNMRFLRPMFWDERLELRGCRTNGRIERFAVINPDGKQSNAGTVRDISYA